MRLKRQTCAITSVLFLFLHTLAVSAQTSGKPQAAAAPTTAVAPVTETVQGTEITDPYRWLEDQNSAQTRVWIDAQNAYTDSILAAVPGREALRKKVEALLKIETMSSPVERNGRYFFTRRQPDQDQPVLYMRQGLDGKDQLLVDPLVLSPRHTISVSLISVSQDGALIIYALRQGGEDEFTPRLFDVAAHKDLPEKFPRARYSGISILPDKSGIYLTRQTDQGPRVFFHKMGTVGEADTEIFGKGYGPEKIITSGLSWDGRYLIVQVMHGAAAVRTELYSQDLKTKGPMTTVVNDLSAVFVTMGGGDLSMPAVGAWDKMYLRTNWNAPRWRVMEVDLKKPGREHWREVIPQGKGVLDSLALVGGKLAVTVSQDVIVHSLLYETTGKFLHEIVPPTLGNLSALRGSLESPDAFYSFSSFHVPPTIYRYNVATGYPPAVWFRSQVPLKTDQYEVKQVWYPSKDGVRIPMFLAHAKGIKLDGSHPTLLTGYGGFNLRSNPGFSAFAAAWMSSGGVWALANLRGGSEFGEDWHHAGMLDKKQNVFDDFIAAAEWLVKNGYTTPARLAIRGRSNGGLLVGAAMTQRPDLFGAVSCGYPLLDMVRYHKFLVAGYWVPEYGSSENPEQFKYIYAYSPYHHVKAGEKYPAVLFITGDSDTRVSPLHARKMTALMQASTGSGNPVLLHYDTQAGHSGGTPIGREIDDVTDELSFLMWQLGK